MEKNKKEIKKLVDFYKKAEKLKVTTRHSWLSDLSRQESVAEHSWMLCLLAILLSDKLNKKVDLLRVIKMVTIHDLAESVTGDIPSHEISLRQKNKHKNEKKVLKNLVASLSKEKASEILALWDEFNQNRTWEAKFANSLDKVEAVMQHNLHIKKWDQGDFDITPYYKDFYFDFDPFMRIFKDEVNDQLIKNIIKEKVEHRMEKKHLERYKNKI
jgi:putative hydrolase of HD superfamily